MINSYHKGIITTYILVFGAIFMLLLSGLLGFILLQLRQASQRVAFTQALEVAEAGIDYYKWCLNNNVAGSCQSQKNVYDLSGNLVGEFVLVIDPSTSCGTTTAQAITSTGTPEKFPDLARKIRVLYSKESVAAYTYLLNDNVWAGDDREIRGVYHSNGGIRMDGENQSIVSSSAPNGEWVCTDSFGCSPCPTAYGCRTQGRQCICPGVFTTTDNSSPDLFDFPVTTFDFDRITINLADIKDIADDSPQEYYWPPVGEIDSDGEGYHVKFLEDGTFEVWIITDLDRVYGYSIEEGWKYDYFSIGEEYRYGNPILIDPDCSLIFVEDNLWLGGKVKGKVTIASANLISTTEETDIILPEDIEYTTFDGSDGLTVISERNILISPDSPSLMEIHGIFVAQEGRFSRNHYPSNIREKLEIIGSMVSNGRVGTQWTSGGIIVSGYMKREDYNDVNLIYNPPAFTPSISSEFQIVNWEEL